MPRRKKADPQTAPQDAVLETATAEAPVTEAPEAAPSAPKLVSKPQEMEVETILQYAGFEWSLSELKEKAIASYVADGHRRGNIRKLTMYLKPEERAAYYVVNDKVAGGVELDL